MQDQAVIAALMAIAMAMVKVFEKLAEWVVSKLKDGKGEASVFVRLDPESSRMMRESHERVQVIHDTITVRDNDGIPMVFSSRKNYELAQAGALQLHEVHRDLTLTGEKVDKVGERLEDVDRRTDEILRIVRKV